MPSEIPTVGFVIDDLGIGGAQKQLMLVASALVLTTGTRVYVLSTIEAPHGRSLRARGVPVTTMRRRSNMDPTRLVRLTRAMGADRVDVVHGFLDASNVYAFLAARALRKPVVLSLRSQLLTLRGVRGRVLRALLRRADAVTVNSEAGRAFLVERVRVQADRVVLLPNIVAPASAAPPRDDTAPVVGCVGRLVGLKRFDAVLRAFPRVRAAVPDARLEMVGDGPELGALRALARELDVEQWVDFTGAVDDATTRMAAMACVVFASEFEGLPNAALESIARGVPVVAVPVGDLPSIVVDGSTGVVVGAASPEILAAGIVRALTDRALRRRAQDEGPRLVRERYSVQAALAVLLPLYQRLSKRTGAAALEATTPVLGE